MKTDNKFKVGWPQFNYWYLFGISIFFALKYQNIVSK